MQKFIDNIELWLSGAGLVVILIVPQLLTPSGGDFWKVATITAVVVGTLHGAIFWVIRRRQRKIRRRSIMEIREMLADVVKNQLTVIDMYLPQDRDQAMVEQELEGIKESIEQITEQVDSLSEESLQDWKTKYPEAIENATQLGPA